MAREYSENESPVNLRMGLKCKATKGERNSHIHSVTPTPHPRRYGLVASAVLRCINNKPTFEAKLQNTWPTYLHKINLYCILTHSSNNAAKRKQCWPYCKMELTGLQYSHAHFLSFSYLISREYLKKSVRSVVRDDVLGKFPLAIVGFECQRHLPVVICFKVATGWHCVANGKMLLLSFCICRRVSFRWSKVNF